MKFKVFFVLTILSLVITGCFEKRLPSDAVVAYVGSVTISKSDFIAALEVSKIGYDISDIIKQDKAIKKRVLSQLLEEEIVISNANVKGFIYSDDEFVKDLQKVEKEYPDGVLAKLLEENAITYDTWKTRFKKEREFKNAVDFLIADEIRFSINEIKKGYLKYCKDFSLKMKDIKNDINIRKKVMERLREKKSSIVYTKIFENLKKNTPIKINHKVWLILLKKQF